MTKQGFSCRGCMPCPGSFVPCWRASENVPRRVLETGLAVGGICSCGVDGRVFPVRGGALLPSAGAWSWGCRVGRRGVLVVSMAAVPVVGGSFPACGDRSSEVVQERVAGGLVAVLPWPWPGPSWGR